MSKTEQALELEIQEKGLNAPRLNPQHIDATIFDTTYTNLPDGRTVVCQLTLRNGFTVDGKSACVSADNFNQDIGNEVAYKNAREKIWELEGYLLKERLHNIDKEVPENIVIKNGDVCSFSDALATTLKADGIRIARKGWNGAGLSVYKVTPEYGIEPHLVIRTSTGRLNTWVPSSADLLAEDWVIL